MPDIHFHDVYAEFEDGSFTGIENSISKKSATIRTMEAQLNSTRLFNENYFALLAALDDAASKGIRLVALPGDFSDDGQPIHLRGLQKILNHYSDRYGMEFFAAPGNHDPVRPFPVPGGKSDFLGEGGHNQRIFSRGARECKGYEGRWTRVDTGRALPTICTGEIRHLGYRGVMETMADFGFAPQPEYLYWETPYSSSENLTPGNYDFERAQAEAGYRKRQYEICRRGSGGEWKKPDYRNCHRVPDASYLVEPVPGLWLLSIDANVYVPDETEIGFRGSGNAGYNRLLTHKRHLLDWIRDLVRRAERADKRLIAFSHFPMTGFYDGQSDAIASLFGDNTFQLKRRPREHVSRVLAETGIQVHVGGHMHINDTGIARGRNGGTLFNIQAPSLAAYLPAYKILTLHNRKRVEVETVTLDRVPRFDELFEHYRQEYDTRARAGEEPPWNREILESADYRTFTRWHIRELSRQRFLPGEWPQDLKELLLGFNGKDLLLLTRLPEDTFPSSRVDMQKLKKSRQWAETEKRVERQLSRNGKISLRDLGDWTGFDLAVDFYRLRNGGALARRDIGDRRLAQYHLLAESARHRATDSPSSSDSPLAALSGGRFAELLGILEAFRKSEPDDHFMLELAKGKIRRLDAPGE
ncbi:metallophosphoesterase [Microbulbifer halophilus]|uniref:Metallophosphoesterase n=2 Tax=Microbulbifer halophilus TaxID=453963 RepID=A0ABW5E6U4_9GAMM